MPAMKSIKVPSRTWRRYSRLKRTTGKTFARLVEDGAACLEQQHRAAVPFETTARAEREVKPVDAGDQQAQGSVDAQTCTSSESKEGVGGKDALSCDVESTSQNAAPQPHESHSPPHGTGQK